MERDTWRVVVAALRRLPRRCSRGQRYSNRDVLAVLLWATLHDRSILWACRRTNWPMQAWRRRLPDQSTVSRRLRRTEVLEDLRELLHQIQSVFDDGNNRLLRVDGKALAVSSFSQDADAANGYGAGQFQHGYKLHVLVANARRILEHQVEPMNTQESKVAEELLRRAASAKCLKAGGLLLGDASYDSNPLHGVAHSCNLQLLAPRRRPGTGLSTGHSQHPGRVRCIGLLENRPRMLRWHARHRCVIEHYFGGLSAAGGLHTLPPWVRGLIRVRLWIAAKIALNAARLARLHPRVA